MTESIVKTCQDLHDPLMAPNELETAEEVTDDESVKHFEIKSNTSGAHSFHSSIISSYDSNSTMTPFEEGTTVFNNSRRDSLTSQNGIKVPIIGYEVMEERSRLTVYKLRVENQDSSWFVYRRYTDFVRLCNVLKSLRPDIVALLPKKRYLGNNFDPDFLNNRIEGLQLFINAVIGHEELLKDQHVQDFLCLNESILDTEKFLEDSRVICDALSETIHHLRNQLKEKDMKIMEMSERVCKTELALSKQQEFLNRQCVNCENCSEELRKNLDIPTDVNENL